MKKPDGLSLQITPVEIKNKEFKKTFWGYSPKEVVEFLDHTARAWEGVRKHEKTLLSRVEELEAALESWKQRESELQNMRGHAEQEAKKAIEDAAKEAAEYFEQVQERAKRIREKTETWLARVIDEMEKAEDRKRAYVNSIRSALDQHYALLDQEEENSDIQSDLSHLLNDGSDDSSKEKML